VRRSDASQYGKHLACLPKFRRQRIVFSVVPFGEIASMIFNHYAFMLPTVTRLAMQLPQPDPYLWMAVARTQSAKARSIERNSLQ
jgi:hypothetical protein